MKSFFLFFACLAEFASAQTLNYYFAHIASGGPWRTTFTLVNQTTLSVTCNTSFYSDSGSPLTLTFSGAAFTSTTDDIPAGGLARRQTDAQTANPTVTGWATASCTGPVKASALFRSYNGPAAQAEASVPAMLSPATSFVTYADSSTGVAYANPSTSAASITFMAKNSMGMVAGTKSVTLAAGAHGSQQVGALLGLANFQGSITITSTVPIVSLSLNAEASPVISSLPPGQPDGSPTTGPAVYYFAHIAYGGVWRTTFTYVNASPQTATCDTKFYSDSGSALALSFGGVAVTSTSDTIPAGGIARRQTDALPLIATQTGWAVANCSAPVKASALFREYNGSVAQGEASVLAMTSPVSQFITYADQSTGVAFANPGTQAASVTITAQNQTGATAGTATLTLAPGEHTEANIGPLVGISSFSGSILITSLQPIVSLSLNAEAYPSFSSLPPGDGSSFQVYGLWSCGNDQCNWRTVRDMTEFDSANHWMIDRGDGTGLPSVNLVVLSFVQPTKLLNQTNDSATANGIPIGMNAAVVNYFASHNVRVMLSIGGATYVADWDSALTSNPTQLGLNAANAAKALGVGIEIDYENNTSPNLTALAAFLNAYRSVIPFDPTGTNPAALVTIDLAAGDEYLVALCQQATGWLTSNPPLLNFANATVPNGQPTASAAETNWAQHTDGMPKALPPVLPLPPADYTGAVRLEVGTTVEPECTSFSASLQNATGIFAETISPSGAGITPGMLGYMFWGAEAQAPATCEGGVGVGARNYNIPIPLPILRRQ